MAIFVLEKLPQRFVLYVKPEERGLRSLFRIILIGSCPYLEAYDPAPIQELPNIESIGTRAGRLIVSLLSA